MIRLEAMRPGETRDYAHDWSPFLGEDIIQSESTSATGISVANHHVESGDQSVRFRFTAGMPGLATIMHSITTASGQIETEIFTLWILSAEEPVSVAEAKRHLRVVDNDTEDDVIAGYIRASREWVERESGHILVRRTFVDHRDTFGSYIDLHRTPILSPVTVEITPDGGAPDEFAGFVSHLDRRPPRLTRTSEVSGDVTITYVAGYGEGEAPPMLVQAVLVLVTGMFMNRGGPNHDAEKAAADLCESFSLPVLA
jgi:uncharacterized phiE125 gp8 family phage protein